ncbi:permease [Dongia deserti]|uniref:permease n=1 Tax=Dongia deserti TaxID=2268030 RepID=UPI0013C479D4|nr:permease [Dongia deserti]
MSTPASWLWLARHEARLAIRDLRHLMTAGGRWRIRNVAISFALLAVGLHLLAFGIVAPHAEMTLEAGTRGFTSITGTLLLTFFLLLSQSLEHVTRLFYGRGDLDLFRSSPAPLRRLFAIRVLAIAVSSILMSLVVALPAVNMLALLGGLRWFAALGVAVATALAAAGIALVLAALLFDTLGPRRTRFAAQVASAIIGSAFIIGVQAVAILSIGTLSPRDFFDSDLVLSYMPPPDNALWIPARAVLGSVPDLALTIVSAASVLIVPMVILSGRLGGYAIATASVSHGGSRPVWGARLFRTASPRQLLQRKEWMLLVRDPWLASQSLMQLLYLIPAGLLLWRFYGDSRGALLVLAPVLTMAAGQLGGGLAWLAVSGEDAPDLIATAPISPTYNLTAKVEAVLIAVFAVFAPFLIGVFMHSWLMALVIAGAIFLAAASSTLIQIWFRSQAKRRYFRRRQTSSRIATFAEAFSSVAWASAAALAMNESWYAVAPTIIAMLVLTATWSIRPR